MEKTLPLAHLAKEPTTIRVRNVAVKKQRQRKLPLKKARL
jgi:hypothetical protein